MQTFCKSKLKHFLKCFWNVTSTLLEIKEQIYQKRFLKIDFKTFNRRFFFSFCEMRESLGRGILEILQMKNKTHNIPVLYSGFDLLKRFASPLPLWKKKSGSSSERCTHVN